MCICVCVCKLSEGKSNNIKWLRVNLFRPEKNGSFVWFRKIELVTSE